jgi:hypothetical protein
MLDCRRGGGNSGSACSVASWAERGSAGEPRRWDEEAISYHSPELIKYLSWTRIGSLRRWLTLPRENRSGNVNLKSSPDAAEQVCPRKSILQIVE